MSADSKGTAAALDGTGGLAGVDAKAKLGSAGLIRLEAPGTGFMDTWRAMGPGIAAAMTGIGASHIMHAPTAGARFGYDLLWVILAAYILKYCAFEFAHRYTMVKGESIINAYHRVGRWPLAFLIFQVFANTVGIAGRALGCAALMWAAFPFMPLEAWAVTILVGTVAILWLGSYGAVEGICKLLILVFAVSCFLAFALQAPPPGEYLSRLLPTLPPIAAMMLFGAMFGYFPTTLEVAPMQSIWAVEKKVGMVKVKELEAQGHRVEMDPNYMKNSLILFKRDMNISYIVSMLSGMIFLIVGAVVLFPAGLVPKGSEMGIVIASIYTETFGAWIFPVIIAGGVAALFSTVFTYFDGQARIFEECSVRLKRDWDNPQMRKILYRTMQVIWLVAGIAIVFGLPEPIFVTQVASVMALVFSPVLFWLTIRAIKDNFVTDFERELLPSKLQFAWAWFGTFALLGLTCYVLYYQFLA
ncbi:Nramp family divalent metal transporter [Azospirillum halopraeferens]|uniref:Nramp family divalent metal transporter n=1 Tax=Azospirillum halopraeferens TaxID=34010 RepID=UPI00041BB4C0|nr:Nramp family divalent metal transporter [Azospirillum halopraeferens]